MNIFYLHDSPEECAKMHNNKHCVKMILESAQMLCTTHRHLDQFFSQDEKGDYVFTQVGIMKDNESVVYKTAHLNHPSTKWVRESGNHYMYLYNLFVALCDEYTFRYGKVHLTDTKLRNLLKEQPKNIPNAGFKKPPQCMPMVYKNEDTILAYRTYYMSAKSKFMDYKKREAPQWVKDWNKGSETNE